MHNRRLPATVLSLLCLTLACGGDDGPLEPVFVDEPRPGKRSDIATVADAISGKMVIFGGDNGPIVAQRPMPSYIGDTWLLDPEMGFTEISGTSPSARGRYAVAKGADRTMLLFGGRYRAGTSGSYTLFNDVWSFDYTSESWTELSAGGGAGPSPRYFSTAAVDSSTGDLIVFGGGTNTSPIPLQSNGETWRFDGSGWSQVTTTGSAPSQRLFMAYAHDTKRNRLVVFGGQVGDFVSASFNDLYALDLATGVWTQLSDGISNSPIGRFSAMLAYDEASDRYLLFGGHADPGVVNDIWLFDPNIGNWTQDPSGDRFTGGGLGCAGNSAEIPSDYVTQDLDAPERRSGSAVSFVGGSFYIVGGESDCSDHLDDIWRFDTDTATWAEVLGTRTGESCARRNDDCPCLCL